MRAWWAGSLGAFLGITLASASGGEIQWRAAKPKPETKAVAASRPAASLGRPTLTPSESSPRPENGSRNVIAASYDQAPAEAPSTARGQNPDFSSPTLAPPPGVPGDPLLPTERYNCGQATVPPGMEPPGYGIAQPPGCCFSFKSDHCFDGFISPVTNPFLFEDPRALTEGKIIFMQQDAPSSQYVFRGGDIGYFGFQGRLAVTERLSFVMTKFGWIWTDPNTRLQGFDDTVGFSEIWLGPKYTFLRNESCGTLGAVGLQFQIPSGPGKVFQDTGDLSLVPYVSMGQNFGWTNWGSFNALGTVGYAFGTDSLRSDYLFLSGHLDFDVLGSHKWYPFVEMNAWVYGQSGSARNLGFEGRDLFNFGSSALDGHKYLTIAPGLRYKFCEAIQTGAAVEFPLIGTRDLLDYRLTVDLIFRY